MMKKYLFVIVLSLFFGALGAQNNSKITPELFHELSVRNQNETIKITIILDEQYDQALMRCKSNAFQTKEAKRSFVINELKAFSGEKQKSLTDFLLLCEKSGKVSGIKSYWISNAISCYAPADVIEELALREDIRIIGFDKKQLVVPETEGSLQAGPAKNLPYNLTTVKADTVWKLDYSGENVVVAVIDTGVNYNHTDLSGNMWEHPDYPYHGYDTVNDDNDPMDDHSHGTHCAGTVAGNGSSGIRTGIAPSAKIMAVKTVDAEGYADLSQIIAGIEFAVEHGADVLSMSIGFAGGGSQEQQIQFRNAMTNVLEAGIVASIAAGNERSIDYIYPPPNNIRVPSNCPPPWLHPDQTITGGYSAVICVGATDRYDQAASFTSIGPVTWQTVPGFEDYPYNPGIGLIRPDVCAPGIEILSLAHDNNSDYLYMNGTSMAAPCVAGVIALMLSKSHALTPAQIGEILETTALPLSTGKSNLYGSGRVDALEAIRAISFGPIAINDFIINDEQGNDDGKLNAGETIDISLYLENMSDIPLHDVSLVLSTHNEKVTIINNHSDAGAIAAGEIKDIQDAFTIKVSDNVIGNEIIRLFVKAAYEEGSNNLDFGIPVYDYIIEISNIIINDSGENNNGMLDPGETAEMIIYLKNTGNETADGISGELTSDSPYVTIHGNASNEYGYLLPGYYKYRSYTISLDGEAKNAVPFNMHLSDPEGKVADLPFRYELGCPIVFELFRRSGNGWQGAAIEAYFNDGTPPTTITLENGANSSYILNAPSKNTVSLSWISGPADDGCYFNIYYEGGEEIYRTSNAPSQGLFFNFLSDCSESYSQDICHAVSGLSSEVSGSTVSLSWNTPEGGTAESYILYRDGVFLDHTGATAYTQHNIQGGSYDYCVEALYPDECMSGKSCVPADVACVTPSTPAGEAVSDTEIRLSWPSGVNQGYNIYRDAVEVATGITDTFYLDSNLNPFTEYCYTVTALCKNNEESGMSGEICVTTKEVSITEVENNVIIHPNPADTRIFIEGDGLQSLSVYNMIGILMDKIEITGQPASIHTAAYRPGVYLLEITTKSGLKINKKVIIHH